MKRLILMLVAVVGVTAFGKTSYVDEFDLSASSCGQGKRVMAKLSVVGTPLNPCGKKIYQRGFGTCPESAIAFKFTGRVTSFDAMIGVDAEHKKVKSDRNVRAVVKIWADGKVVAQKEVYGNSKDATPIHADFQGARVVVLETISCAPWIAYNASYIDWADARFTMEKGAKVEILAEKDQYAQLGILTPPEKEVPQFNGADIWGVRPTHPVIFRVPVTGVRPMKFSAKGLPDGVTFDDKIGVLRGNAPAKKGDYNIEITATNAKGTAKRTITLRVGDMIALTPPLGWNSWNIWGWRFTGDHAKAAAKAMDESGLANHGWAYINLDDWWEMNNSGCELAKKRPEVIGPARDAKGKIITNSSFPDMKGMTDYIHSLGLKAGLYSSPGTHTCGGCEGSLGHEMQDAESWADWGFDYIKYDWCSYGDVFKKETGWGTWEWMGRDKSKPLTKPAPKQEAFSKPYFKMRDCLKAQKRDIFYSFCQYGIGESEKWAREAGANSWRSWQDLKDTWPWLEVAIEGYVPNAEFWKYTGPGCWADPDMMIVGLQTSFGSTHPTYLTPNEQYSHVSLWALLCSPMLIGCDLTKLDPFTRNLLMNDEVIAISQDRLGRPARRYIHEPTHSIWVRPLANGDWAVGLVNRFPLAREVSLDLSMLGLSGKFKVHDCWKQVDDGVCEGTYKVKVLPHATKLIRLKPMKEAQEAKKAQCVSNWNLKGKFIADKVEKGRGCVVLSYDKPDKRPIWFGGRSKSDKASFGGDYCVYLDIQHDDGSWTWAVRTQFSRGTHDWQPSAEVHHPVKPVAKIQFFMFLRNTTGTADFDGAFLKREMPPEGSVLWERRFTEQPYRYADRVERTVIEKGKRKHEMKEDKPITKIDCPLAPNEVVVWPADSMRRISPLDFPTADDRKNASGIELQLAKGECESVQISISSGMEAGGKPISAEVVLPTLADGTALNGEVEMKRIGYLARRDRYRHHPLSPDARNLWFAEPLLPWNGASTLQGGTQGIWLTFKAKRNAKSGMYLGKVKVAVDGKTTEIPYRLEICNFALPERFSMKASYSVMDGFTRAAYPNDFKRKQRESWDLMLDHRLSPDDISRTTPPNLEDVGYALGRGMNFFNVLNLVPPPKDKNSRWVCWVDPDAVFNEDFYSYLKKTLTPYIAELRKRGWDKYAYIYGFDEREQAYYEKLLPLWKRLKADFGLPVMTTAMMYRDVTQQKLSVGDPLATMTDIHVPLESVYDEELAEQYRAAGREVWWYTCCGPEYPWCNNASYEYPLIECRLLAWVLRKTRADGYLFWHVNYWADQKIDEKEAFQPDFSTYSGLGMPGDGVFLYPGKEHIVPGIRLANIRDGEEDYEWMVLAEQKVGKDEVQKILREMVKNGKDFSRDPKLLRDLRSRLACLIQR